MKQLEERRNLPILAVAWIATAGVSFTVALKWQGILEAILPAMGFAAVALIPGWTIASSGDRHPRDLWEKLILSLGVGVSAIALTLLLATALGMPLTLGTVVVVSILWAIIPPILIKRQVSAVGGKHLPEELEECE